MLINLWSTPRTGSVWYSKHLQSLYPGSRLITEMFNRYHMNMYHLEHSSGSIQNYHDYIDNGFYKEFYLDNLGHISIRKVYDKRTRTIEQEEQYCFDLVKSRNNDQIVIMHNHVLPIREDIRQYLLDKADRNIWIYRKDRRAQLASYAVAISTRKFAQLVPALPEDSIVTDCNEDVLTNLIKRIAVWDKLSGPEQIAFEDIEFYNRPGFPYDQNTQPWARISGKMQQTIDRLVCEYENNTNR